MAELTTTKLNAESHLILDQPLLRMPYELSRRNQKTAQRYLENSTKDILTLSTKTAKQSPTLAPSTTLENIDTLISKMQGLKRKISTLHDEEKRLHKSTRARLQHLQDLYEVQSLVDVKYDEWSRVRLSRLLVDYLLREGYEESAAHLAMSQEITELVDVDAFVACHRIEKSLREESNTALALNWCKENAKELKKLGNDFELELRLQQYVELVRQGHERGIGGGGDDVDMDGDGMNGVSLAVGGGRQGGGEQKLAEARAYAKKYLSPSGDFASLGRAAGLLAYRPWDDVEPYASLYSSIRWDYLASLFRATHHILYSLPHRPLLHIALSAGLSALKTPSCHSAYTASSGNIATATTSVCPICSTELNDLARNVPYAHHTKSIVEADPVVLPNGRIYGKQRLKTLNEGLGVEKGWVRDPVEGLGGQKWAESEVSKVYIS
ncbi:protein FYV10 [Byssothecium circinans]|uniref:Protein FYV10 n=1 Tax=Byssothecium circinans TaxID=147558 RepID=A0A6A5U956_9PLEO|nr:protein FYV10 [Byssothecium circinans]